MTTLTAADVLELALGAGFSRADADVMTVISHYESAWNPADNGDLTLSRYGSVGLWQIFTGAHTPSEFGLGSSGWNKPLVAELFVPATNAHAARVVFGEQGFTAWSTYNSYHATAEWAALLKQVQAIKATGAAPAPAPKVSRDALASKGNTNAHAAAAIEYAKAEVAKPLLSWKGLCASFVRNAYTVNISAWGSVKRTAAEAAALVPHAQLHGWYTAPMGCPVYWTGGSTGAGHVALADGKGNVYSTDFGPNGYIGDGKVRLIPQTAVSAHDKSLKCVGWGESFLGVRVYGG
jgi:hypothetical protein